MLPREHHRSPLFRGPTGAQLVMGFAGLLLCSSCSLALDVESLGEGCSAGSELEGCSREEPEEPLDCGSGEFSREGECLEHTTCGDDEYEVQSPSTTSDRVCRSTTHCQPGEYEHSAPRADADRRCRPCPSGTFSDTQDAPVCEAWSVCEEGHAERSAPSEESDRVCSPCGEGEFVLDSQCSPLSACAPGMYVALEGTPSSDRLCEPCPEETFSTKENSASCQPWSECPGDRVPSEDPEEAPSSVRDRTCVACDTDTFLQDGQCVSLSVCGANEYETVAPSATEDRECGLCFPDEIVAGQRICAPFGPIQNAWADEWYIHIEDGAPQATAVNVSLPGAQWSLEPIDGYYRIRNRYERDQYLHVEGGELQAGPISRSWLSAQWLFIDVTETYGSETQAAHRIQNRENPDLYLHVEWGELEAATIGEGWHSSVWFLPPL